MEKVVLACLGSFLEEGGTKSVLVEAEVFELAVIDSIFN